MCSARAKPLNVPVIILVLTLFVSWFCDLMSLLSIACLPDHLSSACLVTLTSVYLCLSVLSKLYKHSAILLRAPVLTEIKHLSVVYIV